MRRKNNSSVARLAGVLINPVRIAILERLLDGPCIVNDLAESLGIGQAVVSKQLGVLRKSGLLGCQPNGRCREYHLAEPELFKKLYLIFQDIAGKAEEQAKKCSKQFIHE